MRHFERLHDVRGLRISVTDKRQMKLPNSANSNLPQLSWNGHDLVGLGCPQEDLDQLSLLRLRGDDDGADFAVQCEEVDVI